MARVSLTASGRRQETTSTRPWTLPEQVRSPQLVELTGTADRVVTVADHQRAAVLGLRSVNADNDSRLLRRAAVYGASGAYVPHISETVEFPDTARAHALAEAHKGKSSSASHHGSHGRLPKRRCSSRSDELRTSVQAPGQVV